MHKGDEKYMIKKRKEYMKQLKKNKAMEAKIKSVKTAAKKDSEDKGNKFVKSATEGIKELYSRPEFSEDENFLLYRYSKVEGKDRVWTNLCR